MSREHNSHCATNAAQAPTHDSDAPAIRTAYRNALDAIHAYVRTVHGHYSNTAHDVVDDDIQSLQDALHEARFPPDGDTATAGHRPQPRRHSFYPSMPPEALDPAWWIRNAVPRGQVRTLLHPKDSPDDYTLLQSIVERNLDTSELWDALAHRMFTARRHAKRIGTDSPWGATPCHPPLRTNIVGATTDDNGDWHVITLDSTERARADPERPLEHYAEEWLSATLAAGACNNPIAIEVYRDEATDRLHPNAITAVAHEMIAPLSTPLTDELDVFCNSARRLDDEPTERLLRLVRIGLEDTRALANILEHESRAIVRHAILESIALETIVLARISEQLTDRATPTFSPTDATSL